MGLIKKYLDYRKQREININRVMSSERKELKTTLHNKSMLEIVEFINSKNHNSSIITNDYYYGKSDTYKSIRVEYISHYITESLILDVHIEYKDSKDYNEPNIKINKKVYLLNQVVSYEIRDKSFLLKFNDGSNLWVGSDNLDDMSFIKKVIYSLPI